MAFGQRFSQADLDRIEAKKPAPVNKKVMGAVKQEQGGIAFASKLELYAYNLLKATGIKFEFQYTIEIQKTFKYRGETIRSIKSIVDFYLPEQNIIIDTKGFATDVSKLKFKKLKFVLFSDPSIMGMPEIILPKNKEEVELLVNRILYDEKRPPVR